MEGGKIKVKGLGSANSFQTQTQHENPRQRARKLTVFNQAIGKSTDIEPEPNDPSATIP